MTALVVSGLLIFVCESRCRSESPKYIARLSLHGDTPPPEALSRTLGRCAENTSLRLSFSLPLRHLSELASLLQRLYEPGRPDYRRYVTPAQFTEKFGPTRSKLERLDPDTR